MSSFLFFFFFFALVSIIPINRVFVQRPQWRWRVGLPPGLVRRWRIANPQGEVASAAAIAPYPANEQQAAWPKCEPPCHVSPFSLEGAAIINVTGVTSMRWRLKSSGPGPRKWEMKGTK